MTNKITEEINKAREIINTLGIDDPDTQEIIKNDTDVFNLIEWACRKYGEEVALSDGIEQYLVKIKNRLAASKKRQDVFRNIAYSLLSVTGEKKHKGVAATLSIKAVPPKKIIQDESKIPDEFWKTTKSIDKTAINEHEGEIPGVVMSNGGETIQIRIN